MNIICQTPELHIPQLLVPGAHRRTIHKHRWTIPILRMTFSSTPDSASPSKVVAVRTEGPSMFRPGSRLGDAMGGGIRSLDHALLSDCR